MRVPARARRSRGSAARTRSRCTACAASEPRSRSPRSGPLGSPPLRGARSRTASDREREQEDGPRDRGDSRRMAPAASTSAVECGRRELRWHRALRWVPPPRVRHDGANRAKSTARRDRSPGRGRPGRPSARAGAGPDSWASCAARAARLSEERDPERLHEADGREIRRSVPSPATSTIRPARPRLDATAAARNEPR